MPCKDNVRDWSYEYRSKGMSIIASNSQKLERTRKDLHVETLGKYGLAKHLTFRLKNWKNRISVISHAVCGNLL